MMALAGLTLWLGNWWLIQYDVTSWPVLCIREYCAYSETWLWKWVKSSNKTQTTGTFCRSVVSTPSDDIHLFCLGKNKSPARPHFVLDNWADNYSAVLQDCDSHLLYFSCLICGSWGLFDHLFHAFPNMTESPILSCSPTQKNHTQKNLVQMHQKQVCCIHEHKSPYPCISTLTCSGSAQTCASNFTSTCSMQERGWECTKNGG